MNHLIPDNLEALTSGVVFDPDFVFADGFTARVACKAGAASHRLVKAPKSPTEQERYETAYQRSQFEHKALVLENCEPSALSAVVKTKERTRIETPHGTAGASTVIEFRDWADEYRVRTQAESTRGIKPPEQSGDRLSAFLSSRGAKKIAEACEYMHLKKGGFKTFLTATLTQEKRDLIASGDLTIQKEVSRTLDAMQKMFTRGWVTESGEKVEGHKTGLAYAWVVEIPKNESGEDNPHVHMLMNWRVKPRYFSDWAKRLERLWGQGYFHIEKIKDCASAGAYMAKAAGYICKAEGQDDQGVVRGNRYGISENARAPDWVTVSKSQLHVMGQLIADIYDHLTVKYGEKYRKRKALNTARDNIRKKTDMSPEEKKSRLRKLGEKLSKVRTELNALPIRCNGYQVIVKGKGAAFSFFNWARTKTEDGAVSEPWLPEKPTGCAWDQGAPVTVKDSHYFRQLRASFERSRFWRRLASVPEWITETFSSDEYWGFARKDYESERFIGERESFAGEYYNLDLCQ